MDMLLYTISLNTVKQRLKHSGFTLKVFWEPEQIYKVKPFFKKTHLSLTNKQIFMC